MSETRERHNSSQATEDSRMGSRHDDTITSLVDYDEVDIVLKDGENTWRLDRWIMVQRWFKFDLWCISWYSNEHKFTYKKWIFVDNSSSISIMEFKYFGEF